MDANSLYPTAMCLPLPVDQFTWVDNVDNFNVTEHADDAEYGYVLEIDGETPVDKRKNACQTRHAFYVSTRTLSTGWNRYGKACTASRQGRKVRRALQFVEALDSTRV